MPYTFNPFTNRLDYYQSGGGGTPVTTINGDTGSITGATVTIYAHNATNNSGSSVKFVNSGTVSTLNVTDNSNNTFIGKLAGSLTVSGVANTGYGLQCLQVISGGNSNTFVGEIAGGMVTFGSNNCGFGGDSLGKLTSGNLNSAFGKSAANAYTSTESSNIVIGHSGVIGDNHITRIGTQGSGAGQQNECFIAGITGATPTSGNTPQVVLCDNAGNLAIISSSTAGFVLTSNGAATPSFQAASGGGVTSLAGTANQITASASTGAVTLSTPSTFIAPGSSSSTTTLSAGTNFLVPNTITSGTTGVILQGGTRTFSNFGSNNIFVGAGSGNTTTTAANSTGIGVGALSTSVNSSNSTAVGYLSQGSGADNGAANNTSLGYVSLQYPSTGGQNTAIGSLTMSNTNVSGSDNVALGFGTLENITSGNSNCCLGQGAGINYTTESSNICVGQGVLGTVSETNTTRIGNGQTACFISGIVGNTVSNAELVTINSSTGQMGVTSSVPAKAFFAYANANIPNVIGASGFYTPIFNSTNRNDGTAFNVATGVFTAPSTGFYSFQAILNMSNIVTSTELAVGYTGSVESQLLTLVGAGSIGPFQNCCLNVAWSMQMTSGDTVHLTIFSNEVGATITLDGDIIQPNTFTGQSSFSGYLVGA